MARLNKQVASSLSPKYPFTFVEAPDRTVVLANGVDPVLRYDALSGVLSGVGVSAPTTAPVLSPTLTTAVPPASPFANGSKYNAYVRFLDQYGNPSSLSPVSDTALAFAGGPISVATGLPSPYYLSFPGGHNFTTGDQADVEMINGLFDGLIPGQTPPVVPPWGQFPVTVVDGHTVSLDGTGTTQPFAYTGQGYAREHTPAYAVALIAVLADSVSHPGSTVYSYFVNLYGTNCAAAGIAVNTLMETWIEQPDPTYLPAAWFNTTVGGSMPNPIPKWFPVAGIYSWYSPGDTYWFVGPTIPSNGQNGFVSVQPQPLSGSGVPVGYPYVFARKAAATWPIGTWAGVSPPQPGVFIVPSQILVVAQAAHGLPDGGLVFIAGNSMTQADGTWTISLVAGQPAQFLLRGSVYPGHDGSGGLYQYGGGPLSYTAVPVPSSPSVVRRQVLRNTDGQMQTYYVDVDTTDLTSTSFTSVLTDAQLEANPSVQPADIGGGAGSGVNNPPPDWKSVVASHLSRLWLAGEVDYADGLAQPIAGDVTVQGVGTAWPANFAGRYFYAEGAPRGYLISGVDVVHQVLVLSAPYGGATDMAAPYAIRPAPAERLLVYYSAADRPDSWPPTNSLEVGDPGDEITGLLDFGSFLYVLQRRHIYRLTYQDDPATDGHVWLSVSRGCVNQRCWCVVDDAAYMLDDAGVHKFSGSGTEHLSAAIQSVFYDGLPADDGTTLVVDWSDEARLYWHCQHDNQRGVLRWFVTMRGRSDPFPRHALCYQYRLDRWWLEYYPNPICSSAPGSIRDRLFLVGSDLRRVLALGASALDGTPAAFSARRRASGGQFNRIVDAQGGLDSSVVGLPVQIVAGSGKGQERVIVGVDPSGTTLTPDLAFLVAPDATSVYQIGGISWSWRSGWFRWAEDETSSPRDVEMVFRPNRAQATADLTVYSDHAAYPDDVAQPMRQDALLATPAAPGIAVDLSHPSGLIFLRQADRTETYALGRRFVSVALAGVQAADPVLVYAVSIRGAYQG